MFATIEFYASEYFTPQCAHFLLRHISQMIDRHFVLQNTSIVGHDVTEIMAKCILSMSSTLTFDSFPALRIAHRDCFARVECLSQTDMHIGICAVLENSFPLHSNPRAYDDESHIRVVDFAVSVTI